MRPPEQEPRLDFRRAGDFGARPDDVEREQSSDGGDLVDDEHGIFDGSSCCGEEGAGGQDDDSEEANECDDEEEGEEFDVEEAASVCSEPLGLDGDAPKDVRQADDKPGVVIQVYKNTTTIVDDWLHRGAALNDLSLYVYAEEIQRVRVTSRSE